MWLRQGVKGYFAWFFLLISLVSSVSRLYGAEMRITYQDGVTQQFDLQQDPGSIRNIEFNGGGDEMLRPVSKSGIPVTVYWHMADDADLYLNGKPLRRYEPSFKTRGDEAPLPAFSAKATIREGDVFTVGGRRGGSFGFMLIAVDRDNQVVFQTDRASWKVYYPDDRPDWYKPSVAKESESSKVTVQPDPWHPQKTLNARYDNSALSIWSTPDQRFAYLYGIVRFMK